MKEIADIVAAYERAIAENKKTALATVVLVEGSAYRRAGARMLITEDGQLTGAISGGCLEGDALRKARMVILQQEPLLVTYDTMDDDDAKLGVGLGCNGIIHILIEPVCEGNTNPITLLKCAMAANGNSVLVTLFSMENRKGPQPGSCLCLTADGVLSKSPETPFFDELLEDARNTLTRRVSAIKTYQQYTAFVEFVKPLIPLVIVGAGNDAVPVVKMAGILGWDITVVDGRPIYITEERFPGVKKVIAKPDKVLEKLQLKQPAAFVLMTHNYNYEIAFLRELLPLNPAYIGILGPKKKLERMLDELEQGGTLISESNLETIYGPVGLDIGSETSEEIALSIIAEIKAVFSKRNGRSLKFKATVIHSA
ncbi:xanthine/CO dehydrogenase XdhC/CoxF family maturation factor [Mucilaginibacter oryzae]|uniref:Xanthine/CO dehydrogenase XdhC/CoxF family maturation factor n=1 Tax=Mucilaginibacter oryzae TaxID=468058 RepID=A0A316HAU0_9SPHI|nr:XdhC/CoxI family protein [Mucilaginibacter oryzae]PWK77596.1 xanthine/CO dehydrogenase XdhC/CoxF family maturation factor [Mucilaginibacter oryzae]